MVAEEVKAKKITETFKYNVYTNYLFQSREKEARDFALANGITLQGNFMIDVPRRYLPHYLAGIFDAQASFILNYNGDMKLISIYYRKYYRFKADLIYEIETVLGEKIVNYNTESVLISGRQAQKLVRIIYKNREPMSDFKDILQIAMR